MFVTLPEEVLGQILGAESNQGELYGMRRDGGDVIQVRGIAPEAGVLLGRWRRAADMPVAEQPEGELELNIVAGTPPQVIARPGDAAGPQPIRCEVIRPTTDYTARLRGLFEDDRLRGARVAVIGLGSGGSMAALMLTRCGVGAMHLVDFDRLEVHNIARHVCGLDDVGRYKTRALRDLLKNSSPFVEVRTWEADILAEPQALEEAIAGCDLVIAATDSEPAKLAINRACWQRQIPAVYGAAYNRAFGGDVFRALPPHGTCYACLHAAFSEMFAPPPTAAEDFAPGYADPSRMADLVAEPGLPMDIGMIALLLARTALHVLTGGQPQSPAALPGNWLLFGNRAEWVFHEPLERMFIDVPRRADCPVCNYEQYAQQELAMTPEQIAAAAAEILASAKTTLSTDEHSHVPQP